MRERTREELESAIAVARANLIENTRALESTVRGAVDWRRQVRRRPLEFCGAAFVLGLWLGLT